jgi:hypothetical protein
MVSVVDLSAAALLRDFMIPEPPGRHAVKRGLAKFAASSDVA